MMGLLAPVACPLCGSRVRVEQTANPTRTEVTALLCCTEGHRTQFIGRLVPVPADPVGSARRRELRGRVSVGG